MNEKEHVSFSMNHKLSIDKVLLIVPTLGPGGAERMVVELANALPQYDIKTVVCYLDGQGNLEHEVNSKNSYVRCLHLPHKAWPALWRLKKIIKEEQPTLIHAHMPRAAFWASFCLTNKIPLIYTEHNLQKVYPKWGNLLFRSFVPRTTYVIAVSPPAADDFAKKWKYRKNNMSVIFPGIPFRSLVIKNSIEEIRNHYKIGNNRLICAVGAVRPSKAYHNLIYAIDMLASREAKIRTLIVGSTDVVPHETFRIKQEIMGRGLQKVIALTGYVKSSFEFITAADVFVNCSVEEGLPRAILEAMAAGKPVVATDVGGCAEAVVHGETGLIVPPENPAALAEAIQYILEHPDEAQRMGEAGRQRVEKHFTLEAMVRKHVEVYKKVIEQAM
ncbi:MAG: glycosyltransferase [Candidatus Methanomethyliaceae archaeon]